MKQIYDAARDQVRDYTWSPKGHHLAFSAANGNNFRRIHIWSEGGSPNGQLHQVTEEQFNAQGPVWDPEGSFLYYLSAEFLLGRALANNLQALGLYEKAEVLLKGAGLELADLLDDEPEPGLGNGGLGRLAACFLDSMATLGYAGYGYGIRYEFGIFEQEIKNGWQFEGQSLRTWLAAHSSAIPACSSARRWPALASRSAARRTSGPCSHAASSCA